MRRRGIRGFGGKKAVAARSFQPSEHQEQCAIFDWLATLNHPAKHLAVAFPNQAVARLRKANAVRFKREGVKAGFPDLGIMYPALGFHALFIELKVGRNMPTALQNEWLLRLKNAGYAVDTCWGADEAIQTIKTYLSLP